MPQASSGANQGLMLARRMLEPIKSRYAGLTYADLWTFAVRVNQPLARSYGSRFKEDWATQ